MSEGEEGGSEDKPGTETEMRDREEGGQLEKGGDWFDH